MAPKSAQERDSFRALSLLFEVLGSHTFPLGIELGIGYFSRLGPHLGKDRSVMCLAVGDVMLILGVQDQGSPLCRSGPCDSPEYDQ